MSLTKEYSPDGCGGTEPVGFEEIDQREYEEWSLQAELNDYRQSRGEMALLEVLDRFWREGRGMEH